MWFTSPVTVTCRVSAVLAWELTGVDETIFEVVLSTTAIMMRTTTVVKTMAIMVLNIILPPTF